MDREIRELLVQTLTVEPYQGRDVHSDPVFGPPVTYSCRVVYRRSMIRDNKGEEATSNVRIILPPEAQIGLKDRITLPDGSHAPIVAIEPGYDERGHPYHITVYTWGAGRSG